MALIDKYRKQMALTIAGAIAMGPVSTFADASTDPAANVGVLTSQGAVVTGDDTTYGYIHDLPDKATDYDNPLMIGKDDTAYKLDELIREALWLVQLHTSTTDGLEFKGDGTGTGDDDLYIQADDVAFVALKNILETNKFSGEGAKDHVAELVIELSAALDAVKKLTPSKGIGSSYKSAIDELKKNIHFVDAHLDFSAARTITTGTATPPTPPNPTKPTALTKESTSLVPIAISNNGNDIATDKYWVTDTIHDALVKALADAETAVQSAYADAYSTTTDSSGTETTTLEKVFEVEVELGSNSMATLLDPEKGEDGAPDLENDTTVAQTSDEEKYDKDTLKAADEKYTTLGDLSTAATNLATAYTNYIAAARPGKYVVDNATLEILIARALLGDEDLTKTELPKSISTVNTPKVYIYVKDTSQTPCPKAEATGIKLAGSAQIANPREGFSDDATYFVAPAILNDEPAAGSTWEPADALKIGGESPTKYILKETASDKLKDLESKVETYQKYDGLNEEGTILNGPAYTTEIKDGSSGKLTTAIKALAEFASDMPVKFAKVSPDDAAKTAATLELQKYLIHLGAGNTTESNGSGSGSTKVFKKISTWKVPAGLEKTVVNADVTDSTTVTKPTEFIPATGEIANYTEAARGVFYYISEHHGVDIPDTSYWIPANGEGATVQTDLANAIEEGWNLFTISEDAESEEGENKTVVNADTTTATAEKINGVITKIKTALKAYDDAAQKGQKEAFATTTGTSVIALAEKALTTLNKYVALPTFDIDTTNGKLKITKARTMETASATVPALSDDGIFNITKEAFNNGSDTTDGYEWGGDSNVTTEQKTLIDTTTVKQYVTPDQLDALIKAATPLINFVAYKVKFDTLHDANDDLKKILAGYIDDYATGDKLQKDINAITDALAKFESEMKPVMSYNTNRTALSKAAEGKNDESGRLLIKVDEDTDKTVYIEGTAVVVSDDGGYTYKTYDASNNKWSDATPFEDDNSKKWVTTEQIKDYNDAISATENVILDTQPTLTETGKAAAKGEANSNTTYTEVKWDSGVLAKMTNAFKSSTDDYFTQAKATLDKAMEVFNAAKSAPTDIKAATEAYDNFVAEIGNPYTKPSTGSDPDTHTTLGYIKTTGLTAPTAPAAPADPKTKIAAKLYKFEEGTGDQKKAVSYFPVDVYVSDDDNELINSVTEKLYGYTKGGTADANATPPTTFVHKNLADKLIEEYEEILEFLNGTDKDKKTKEHHLAEYNKDNKYFENEIADLRAAAKAYEEGTKAHKVTEYEDAYKEVQGKLTDGNGKLNEATFDFKKADGSTDSGLTAEVAFKTGIIDSTNNKKIDIDKIELGDTVKLSTDGVYVCGEDGKKTDTALAKDNYWVTPDMFKTLQDAMIAAQEIVNKAASIEEKSLSGYLEDPEYFNTQYNSTGLVDAVKAFVPTKIETNKAFDATGKTHWTDKAKEILYGKDKVVGGEAVVENADAHISDVTGGTDVLTYEELKTIGDVDTVTVISEDELTAFANKPASTTNEPIVKNNQYLDKEYADALKAALAKANATSSADEDIAELALLVLEVDDHIQPIDVHNMPKTKLYNAYVAAEEKKLYNGGEVLPSWAAGADVMTTRYWVPASVLEKMNEEITAAKKMLDQTDNNLNVSKAASSLSAVAKSFIPKQGLLSQADVDAIEAAKTPLLTAINIAAKMVGQDAYVEDSNKLKYTNTKHTGAAQNVETIAVSDVYGTDIPGDDNDGNLIPDGGTRWTSSKVRDVMVDAIATAVEAYNLPKATAATLDAALIKLQITSATFEKNAQFGSKELFASVTATIRKYLSYVNDGNFEYKIGKDTNSRSIITPAVEDLVISAKYGADVATTTLWTSKIEQSKLISAADKAQTFLDNYANPNTPKKRATLNQAILALSPIQNAFEEFYGRDIKGDVKENIIPKALRGTDGIETAELREAIVNAYTAINELAYIDGVLPPTTTYTNADGVSNNRYKPNSDYTSAYVTGKKNGVDVPIGKNWVTSADVAKYALAVNSAQIALNKFMITEEPSQQILNLAMTALDRSSEDFANAKKVAYQTMDSIVYGTAAENLKNAIIQACSVIGHDYKGTYISKSANTEFISGPLNLYSKVELSISGDGGDVSPFYHWVPAITLNAFKGSIVKANTALRNPIATIASLDSAYKVLENATEAFNRVAMKTENQSGKNDELVAEVEQLEILITKATDLLFGADRNSLVFVSANGNDVPNDSKWLPATMVNALRAQITAAENAIFNTKTATHSVTGVQGTGKTTIVALKGLVTSLGNVVKNASAALQDGKLSVDHAYSDAVKARVKLKVLLEEVAPMTKTWTSKAQGTDITDGVKWVTPEKLDGFIVAGEEESIAPVEFIANVYKAANAAYIKPYTVAGIVESYEKAIIDLEAAIRQFTNVLNNKLPNGVELDEDDEAIGGVGTEDALELAKRVLSNRIAVLTNYVNSVSEVSDTEDLTADGEIYELEIGTPYALDNDIEEMKEAIEAAQDAMDDLEGTPEDAAKLTAGSLYGATADPNADSGKESILHILNDAHTKFKTKVTEKVKWAGTILEQAQVAVEAMFGETLPVVAADIVVDETDYDALETHLQTMVEEVIGKAYINMTVPADDSSAGKQNSATVETKIKVTVEVTDATDAIDGDMDEAAGEIGEGSATIKLELEAADGSGSGKIANAPKAVEIEDFEFEIAAAEYKWNMAKKANALEAAAKVYGIKDDFKINGALLNDKNETADDRKAANAKIAVKELRTHIEKLINNTDVEVYIVSEDFDADDTEFKADNIFAEPAAPKAPSIAGTKDPSDAYNEEDGTFIFNVALRITDTEATETNAIVATIRSIATENNIESKVVEIKNDGDGTGGNSEDADDKYYTIIFEDVFEASVTDANWTAVEKKSLLKAVDAIDSIRNTDLAKITATPNDAKTAATAVKTGITDALKTALGDKHGVQVYIVGEDFDANTDLTPNQILAGYATGSTVSAGEIVGEDAAATDAYHANEKALVYNIALRIPYDSSLAEIEPLAVSTASLIEEVETDGLDGGEDHTNGFYTVIFETPFTTQFIEAQKSLKVPAMNKSKRSFANAIMNFFKRG
ncbi:hypothetical protein [Candidatus Epulonipiscium viviparus]|uniref:hypothetical protein n=1 Tax=Candidatus Epulonipiscium viviparus TaxID=420336 RepID=UPI0002E864F7|nr:hypothetical protein [Candidatus Epulopiscium viviparus]